MRRLADYTLEPHDRVLAGTGPEVSYTQWLDFTPAKVPGLAAVQYVDCKTAAGQTTHVEAGGWWTRIRQRRAQPEQLTGKGRQSA